MGSFKIGFFHVHTASIGERTNPHISQYNQLAVTFQEFFGKFTAPGIQYNYQSKVSKYQSKELQQTKSHKHS